MHIGTPVARAEGARTAKRTLGAQRVNTDRKLPPFHRLKLTAGTVPVITAAYPKLAASRRPAPRSIASRYGRAMS
jgi:hypothetical protein